MAAVQAGMSIFILYSICAIYYTLSCLAQRNRPCPRGGRLCRRTDAASGAEYSSRAAGLRPLPCCFALKKLPRKLLLLPGWEPLVKLLRFLLVHEVALRRAVDTLHAVKISLCQLLEQKVRNHLLSRLGIVMDPSGGRHHKAGLAVKVNVPLKAKSARALRLPPRTVGCIWTQQTVSSGG